jgi:hypothetical protein
VFDGAFSEVGLRQEGVVATLRRPTPRARAGVTNDPRRLNADMDLRSLAGRRFSDIYDGLAAEFPGAVPEKLRELTVLKYELEKAQTAGTLTLEDLVRMSHLIERREKALRANRPKRDAGPSLADIIAEHAAQSGDAA